MSGHTPGDWIARPDPHGSPTDFCIGLDDDCSPVDYVAVCRARDARLIAAAPKLLAALKLAVRQNSHDMLMTGDELRVCESAIAKATGVQS